MQLLSLRGTTHTHGVENRPPGIYAGYRFAVARAIDKQRFLTELQWFC